MKKGKRQLVFRGFFERGKLKRRAGHKEKENANVESVRRKTKSK